MNEKIVMPGKLGSSIKGMATILFVLEVMGAFIFACVAADETDGASFLMSIGVVLIALVQFLLLYGFGEIIDKLCEIADNTSPENKKPIAKASENKKDKKYICPQCGSVVKYGDSACSNCYKKFNWEALDK